MMADRHKSKSTQGTGSSPAAGDRTVYSEFGNSSQPEALQRGVPDLPPSQQDLRIQATRKGRGGKTVTIISGFQASPETLAKLLKELKAQCGAGGSVKDNELEVQGDHTAKLLQLLVQKGYRAKISGGKG